MAALVGVGVVVAHIGSCGDELRSTERLRTVDRMRDDVKCRGGSVVIQAVSWWAE